MSKFNSSSYGDSYVEINGNRVLILNGERVETTEVFFKKPCFNLDGDIIESFECWYAPIHFSIREIALLKEVGETGKLSNLEGIELVVNLLK